MTNGPALPAGTMLADDYRIERTLGAGGFGITYLATEPALARFVTIKEYFPADFASRDPSMGAVPRSQGSHADYRWGLDRFIDEAQALARFDHPNIVRAFRYFRANNTGYIVLQFEEGVSLKTWLKGLGRAPRQPELDAIAGPLLDALALIHSGNFLHRDIAPDNIIIRKDGSPVLIDFGSARADIAQHSKTVSALVKPGYSPYEQYAETGSRQGPWTDIYALGATLYHAVTGKRPPDSPSRVVHDDLLPAREAALSSYRPRFLRAIDRALELDIDRRPQSIASWRGELLAPATDQPAWGFKRGSTPAHEGLSLTEALLGPAKTVPLPVDVPPSPDEPVPEGAPKGGLIDFVENMKRKRAAALEKAKGKGKPLSPVAAETMQARAPLEPTPLPAGLPAGPTPKAVLAPVVLDKRQSLAKPKSAFKSKLKAKAERAPLQPFWRARPRPVGSQGGVLAALRPHLLKLAIGACVAGLAVSFEDRLPRFEARGLATISSQTGGRDGAESLLLAQIRGHAGGTTALSFSGQGRYLVSTGADQTLRIWDGGSGALIRTIDLDAGKATALAVEGDRAATGHSDGSIVIWNLTTAERLQTFKRNDASIWDLAFAGGPQALVAASHDWTVVLWNTQSAAEPAHVFEGHENAVQTVAYVAASNRILSGSADHSLKLWDVASESLVRTFKGHEDFVAKVASSPDGRAFASGGLDGSVRLWSASSSRRQRTLQTGKGKVGALAYSKTGATLAVGAADGVVRLYDIKRGRLMRTLGAGGGAVTALTFSADGRRVVAASADGPIRVWSIEGGVAVAKE